MTGKVKRKVTVDNSGSQESTSSKRPSVFERLGPGGSASLMPDRQTTERVEKCRNWIRNGTCPFGAKCRYLHGPFNVTPAVEKRSKKSRSREHEDNEGRKKSKKKSSESKERKKSDSRSPKHHSSRSRKSDHDSKMKSTVVISNRSGDKSHIEPGEINEEPGEWADEHNLDFEEELSLEKKRQQLQKELELELQRERMLEMQEKKVDTASVNTSLSSPSMSYSDGEVGSSSSSSSSSPERNRKQHKKRKRPNVYSDEQASSGDEKAKSKSKKSKKKSGSYYSESKPKGSSSPSPPPPTKHKHSYVEGTEKRKKHSATEPAYRDSSTPERVRQYDRGSTSPDYKRSKKSSSLEVVDRKSGRGQRSLSVNKRAESPDTSYYERREGAKSKKQASTSKVREGSSSRRHRTPAREEYTSKKDSAADSGRTDRYKERELPGANTKGRYQDRPSRYNPPQTSQDSRTTRPSPTLNRHGNRRKELSPPHPAPPEKENKYGQDNSVKRDNRNRFNRPEPEPLPDPPPIFNRYGERIRRDNREDDNNDRRDDRRLPPRNLELKPPVRAQGGFERRRDSPPPVDARGRRVPSPPLRDDRGRPRARERGPLPPQNRDGGMGMQQRGPIQRPYIPRGEVGPPGEDRPPRGMGYRVLPRDEPKRPDREPSPGLRRRDDMRRKPIDRHEPDERRRASPEDPRRRPSPDRGSLERRHRVSPDKEDLRAKKHSPEDIRAKRHSPEREDWKRGRPSEELLPPARRAERDDVKDDIRDDRAARRRGMGSKWEEPDPDPALQEEWRGPREKTKVSPETPPLVKRSNENRTEEQSHKRSGSKESRAVSPHWTDSDKEEGLCKESDSEQKDPLPKVADLDRPSKSEKLSRKGSRSRDRDVSASKRKRESSSGEDEPERSKAKYVQDKSPGSPIDRRDRSKDSRLKEQTDSVRGDERPESREERDKPSEERRKSSYRSKELSPDVSIRDKKWRERSIEKEELKSPLTCDVIDTRKPVRGEDVEKAEDKKRRISAPLEEKTKPPGKVAKISSGLDEEERTRSSQEDTEHGSTTQGRFTPADSRPALSVRPPSPGVDSGSDLEGGAKPEVFSDWSDDDDDILNRDDEPLEPVPAEEDPLPAAEKPQSSLSGETEATKTKVIDEYEGDYDYDPISDDELEGLIEEDSDTQGEKKEGIQDVDWSCLVAASKTEIRTPGMAKRRFTAARILSRIGVSAALAGQEAVDKITAFCQKQLDEEAAELQAAQAEAVQPETNDTEIKSAEESSAPNGTDTAATSSEHPTTTDGEASPPEEVKTALPENKVPVSVPAKFEMLHPIAAFHAAAVIKRQERANLFTNFGANTRALCARKDLMIRRKLCKMSDKMSSASSLRFSHQNLDADLLKLSLQLYRREKPDPDSGSMPSTPLACSA